MDEDYTCTVSESNRIISMFGWLKKIYSSNLSESIREANAPLLCSATTTAASSPTPRRVEAPKIRKGVPLFQVKPQLEKYNTAIFSLNYALYGNVSARIMGSLQEFTPNVEVYSIDEAFMDLEGCRCMSCQELGREIQGKIFKWTGIPVTLGIAETKTLAKVATHIAKRSRKAAGVLDLYQSPYQDVALVRTPVEKVWGIGPKYAQKLYANDITTALALRNANTRWIRKNLSLNAHQMVMELRGISCIELDACPQPRKSATCSRIFGVPIETISELREALAVYVSRAAEKLRRERLAASAVTVSIHTDQFSSGHRTTRRRREP